MRALLEDEGRPGPFSWLWFAVSGVLFAFSTTGLFLWTLFVAPVAWGLRDGLGPDSTTTYGLAALRRFLMTFYWGPVALVLFALLAISLFPRLPRGVAPLRPKPEDDR